MCSRALLTAAPDLILQAQGLGARTMRLPLAEHAPTASARLPLTLTAVLEILLAVHGGSEWPAAIEAAVAPRHLRPPSFENSRAHRRKESRARAAVSWGVEGAASADAAGDDGSAEEGEEDEEEQEQDSEAGQS